MFGNFKFNKIKLNDVVWKVVNVFILVLVIVNW